MQTKEQASTNQRLRAGHFATLFSEGREEMGAPPAPARPPLAFGAAANGLAGLLRALLAPAPAPGAAAGKTYARASSAT